MPRPRILFGAVCLLYLLVTNLLFCASDTLAVVAGQVITSEEFLNRFELSVYPGKEVSRNLELLKQKFLASMVAEKLLSLDANRRGGDLSFDLDNLMRQTEDLFLRDALFRREVLDRIKVGEVEIRAGIAQAAYLILVDAFYFPDSSTGRVFYQGTRLLHSKAFYSFVDSLQVSHDTLEIRYGESTKAIERAIYGKEKGTLSPPTFTEDGYVVFRILQKQVDKEFNAYSPTEGSERVHRVIRNRKSEEKGFEYLSSAMKGVRVEINYSIFRPLARDIQKRIQTHVPTPNDPHYHLTETEIAGFKRTFEKSLGEVLLRWKGGTLTLERVLDELPLSGFAAQDTSLGSVTSGLHAALRFIAQNCFLAQRARELGLQHSSQVRYNVQTFADAFASTQRAESIRSTVRVTPAEVDSFFNKHQDLVLQSVMLKVKRYVASSLEGAAALYNQLLSAQKQEPAMKEPVGEWIAASDLGETGAVVALLNPGELYGPVREGGKYLWYRLVDKRTPVSRSGLEKSLRVANQRLLEEKRRKVLDERIAQLADNSNVQLYYGRLKNVKVTPTQMFTVRYIGFGGKILAVPPLYPREEWIQYLQNKKKIIP